MNKIVDNLVKQRALYGEILSLSRQEQEAIVACNAPLVGALVERLRERLSTAKALEEERMALVAAASPQQQTLEGLCKQTDAQSAQALREAAAALRDTLEKLGALNRLNADLLALQQEYTQARLQQLSEQDNVSNLYGAGGEEKEQRAQTLGLLNSEV